MKSLFWIIVGGIIVSAWMESEKRSSSHPLIPEIQPGGCLPGDPSFTIGGKTYCLPQGIIPY
jgi:hypothetical protein